MRRLLSGSILLPIVLAVPGHAQRAVVPGDVVRVTLREGGAPMRGTIGAATVDRITLRLGDGEERIIPSSTVRSMTVLDGRTQAKGTWARGGFVVGMLGGAALRASHNTGEGSSVGRISVGALLGGLGGALAGLTIGMNFENNHWVAARSPEVGSSGVQREPPPVAMVVEPGAESTVRVGLRLRR